jgi:hypothetical protein
MPETSPSSSGKFAVAGSNATEIAHTLPTHVGEVHRRAERLFDHGYFAKASRSGSLYIVRGIKSSTVVDSEASDFTRTW